MKKTHKEGEDAHGTTWKYIVLAECRISFAEHQYRQILSSLEPQVDSLWSSIYIAIK
jgi:hypothetical protein